MTQLPVRRLPLRLCLVSGESFASYTDRLAAELAVPLVALLAHSGVAERAHWRAVPSGYGVTLERARLAAFARVTGLDPAQVKATLLTAYDGVALDFSSMDNRLQPGYAARIGWAYTAGSNYCPLCLADAPVWKLEWKLPWVYRCVRHAVLLRSHCEACGQRAGAGRIHRETTPAFVGRTPRPGRCAAPRSQGRGGRASQPCEAALAEAPATPTSSIRMADTQQLLLSALSGMPLRIFGEPVSGLSVFNDLRTMVAILLLLATTDDVSPAEPAVAASLQRHVEHRRTTFAQAPTGAGRWAGRFYTGVPQDPSLLAAVIPTAIELLTAPSRGEALERFEWLTDRLVSRRAGALPLPSSFRASVRVRQLIELAGSDREASVCKTPVSDASFDPAQIPQLLWDEVFDREFTALIHGVRRQKARMFCSVALVKWACSLSWPDAATALELSATATAKMAYDVAGKIEAAGESVEFARRLEELTASLTLEPGTDYRARRQRLRRTDSLGGSAWAAIWAPADPPRISETRRRALGAWLWAEHAGGDYRHAPAWRGRWGSAERIAYRRILSPDLDYMRSATLRLYIAQELY